jgi:hypothetical protein
VCAYRCQKKWSKMGQVCMNGLTRLFSSCALVFTSHRRPAKSVWEDKHTGVWDGAGQWAKTVAPTDASAD